MFRDKLIETPKIRPLTLTLVVLFLLVSGCKKEDKEDQPGNYANQRLITLPDVQTIDFTMESAVIKIFNNSDAIMNCEIEYDYNLIRLQYPSINNIAPGQAVEITATPKWKNIINSETIVGIPLPRGVSLSY